MAAIRSGNIPESAILAESQVVREAIRIPGSGIRLVYHSSRAKGFYSTIQLQLTPATVPQSLLRVHLQITIEGTRPAVPWCRIAYPIIFRYRISHLLLGRRSGPGSFSKKSRRNKKEKNCKFLWTSIKKGTIMLRMYHSSWRSTALKWFKEVSFEKLLRRTRNLMERKNQFCWSGSVGSLRIRIRMFLVPRNPNPSVIKPK